MAISQNKYIDISSGTTSGALGDRNLEALLFTKTAVTGKFGDIDARGIVVCSSLSDVVEIFGMTTSAKTVVEYDIASKYFSYISPNGTAAKMITFAHYGDSDETPDAALLRVDKVTNDFGCFAFCEDLDVSDAKKVAEVNAGYNYRYLFCCNINVPESSWIDSDTDSLSETARNAVKGIVGMHIMYANVKADLAIPLAIVSSTDYNATNGSTCMMYKVFGGTTASVTTDKMSNAFDKDYINYYGETMNGGTRLAFYQRGFNVDHTDSCVYMNEVWLKACIETAFFNLVTSISKVPANQDGVSYIQCIITPQINKAKKNGSILLGKTISDSQKIVILNLTNDTGAYDQIVEKGYWLNLELLTTDGSEYTCKYRLVYAKGDAIRKVEGTHNLI